MSPEHILRPTWLVFKSIILIMSRKPRDVIIFSQVAVKALGRSELGLRRLCSPAIAREQEDADTPAVVGKDMSDRAATP